MTSVLVLSVLRIRVSPARKGTVTHVQMKQWWTFTSHSLPFCVSKGPYKSVASCCEAKSSVWLLQKFNFWLDSDRGHVPALRYLWLWPKTCWSGHSGHSGLSNLTSVSRVLTLPTLYHWFSVRPNPFMLVRASFFSLLLCHLERASTSAARLQCCVAQTHFRCLPIFTKHV